MAGVVRLAGTVALRRLAMVTVRAGQVAVAGPAIRIAVVSVIAGIAIRWCELLAALALPARIGAVPGRVEVVAIASYNM